MELPTSCPTIWKLRTRSLSLERPVFMGIVNVTPDSFSDGGRFFSVPTAVDRALALVKAGAGIIDLGGESTRPGSEGVSVEEELRRVMPALEAILDATNGTVPISVDTVKPAVALAAIRAGAEIINDVSPVTTPAMLDVLLETGAGYCVMHSIGTPKTMQDDPQYDDVVEDVFASLRQRRQGLISAGVDAKRITVDPGLGFGKTTEHNWTLVDNMERFHALNAPLLVGPSRKRFISATFPDRDAGTAVVTDTLLAKSVQIIRLHDVGDVVNRIEHRPRISQKAC